MQPSRSRRLHVVPQPPEPEILEPVSQRIVTAGDRPVERENLVRGYEVTPRRYVAVEEEEIRALTPATSTEMRIVEFVPVGEVEPVYFETSYWVAPEEPGAKAYAMLFAAMRDTGQAAVAEVAMHRREHIAILRPSSRSIVMHTMYYSDEVRRETEPEADLELVTKKELDLAQMLVRALSASFDPAKFRDRYRERVRELIAGKAPAEAAPSEPAPPPAADLMSALKASLSAAQAEKKKPASESKPTRKPKRGSGGAR